MKISLYLRRPVHSFLFAAFPVLFLFAHNIRELDISVVFVPLVVVLVVAALSLLLVRLIVKDLHKASLFVSFVLLLFFSYGMLYDAIERTHFYIGSIVVGPHKILFLLYGISIAAAAWLTFVTRKNLAEVTRALNVVALVLVLVSIFNIAAFAVKSSLSDRNRSNAGQTIEAGIGELDRAPNIYYIILDAYGRADVLRDMYGHDNEGFLDYLRDKGFYVAERARSNYHTTDLSVGSALDCSYHDDWATAPARLRKNMTFAVLKQRGYKTIVASSWDKTVRINGVDAYFKHGQWFDDFQSGLVAMTPLAVVIQTRGLPMLMTDQYSLHRERINYVFDTVAASTQWDGPFILYAHIFAPHPPYVFGPAGEEVRPDRSFSTLDSAEFIEGGGTVDEYIAGYRDQLTYINRRLVALVDTVISQSEIDPIIILQGDHGPRSRSDFRDIKKIDWKECYSILNAYYLPGDGSEELYDTITPVNTFRLVLRHYFGMDIGRIDDRCYFVGANTDYKFIDATDRAE